MMSGERLWATGKPRTPARITRARSAVGRRPPAAAPAGLLVAGDVALVPRVGRRERVLAARIRLDDVEEEVRARGTRSRLDRVEPRVADRSGRQAGVPARVVGRRRLELRDPQRPGPVS